MKNIESEYWNQKECQKSIIIRLSLLSWMIEITKKEDRSK